MKIRYKKNVPEFFKDIKLGDVFSIFWEILEVEQ